MQVGEDAGERVVGLDVERLQRLVVLLVVEQRFGEAKARDRLELVLAGVVDHPLQLRTRARVVAGVVEQLRVQQRGARRVRRAAEAVLDLRRRLLRLGRSLLSRAAWLTAW